MSGKHLAVAAVKPDIAWGSCGLVTALPVDRKQSSLALCYSLSVCPWSNINSAGSDRHTLSPPVLVGPVCACLKPCTTPACLCHRGSKRNNSDKSTENTHMQNKSTHQSKRANWHPHRPGGNECVPRLHSDAERGRRGGLYPDGLFFAPPAASRDEPYSPFLSRSCSLTGSSISISRSLSSFFQRQLSLNQSNYQPQNRPQTHLPVHLCLSRLSPCLLWAQTAPPCWIAQRVSDVFFLLLFTIYAQPSDITNKHANCHRHMFLFVVKCSLLVDSVNYK